MVKIVSIAALRFLGVLHEKAGTDALGRLLAASVSELVLGYFVHDLPEQPDKALYRRISGVRGTA